MGVKTNKNLVFLNSKVLNKNVIIQPLLKMNKKVSFTKKPNKTHSAEDWVKQGQSEKEKSEPTKRLTLDVPVSLHTEIKTQCAQKGVKMIDEILPVLKEHFKIK